MADGWVWWVWWVWWVVLGGVGGCGGGGGYCCQVRTAESNPYRAAERLGSDENGAHETPCSKRSPAPGPGIAVTARRRGMACVKRSAGSSAYVAGTASGFRMQEPAAFVPACLHRPRRLCRPGSRRRGGPTKDPNPSETRGGVGGGSSCLCPWCGGVVLVVERPEAEPDHVCQLWPHLGRAVTEK